MGDAAMAPTASSIFDESPQIISSLGFSAYVVDVIFGAAVPLLVCVTTLIALLAFFVWAKHPKIFERCLKDEDEDVGEVDVAVTTIRVPDGAVARKTIQHYRCDSSFDSTSST